ncbi:SIS domain-containing protein [bacterium]|nr:SIS domain-containing protein [bacterium]
MFGKKIKTNMEQEIAEQTKIIPYILMKYIKPENGEIKIDLPQNIRKIILVASGSSYHCARFAVDLLEKFSGIESRAIYSSEFLLKSVIPHDENTLYIFITQSGETSDTVKSVEKVKQTANLATLCITNNDESTIWKLCDYKVACFAGVEHGIAATKSFTAQMLCLILISLKLVENVHGSDATKHYKESLMRLPIVLERALAKRDEIKRLANILAKENTIIMIADGISYSLAKEAALKTKETSYKNISAAILGEFMHGHVAVLNNRSTLVYINVDKIMPRSISNLNKIKADYNPKLIIIGPSSEEIKPDYNITVPCENEIQQMFANVLVMQQLALEIALKLKRNVDHPRGLHKVVIDSVK